jgi:hypothetical protein
VSECPTVARVADQVLADNGVEWAREVVTKYVPAEWRRGDMQAALMNEFCIGEGDADTIVGMSDEIVVALARRLNLMN